MKKFMTCLMYTGLLAFSGAAFSAITTTFDGTTGFTGWTEVYGGSAAVGGDPLVLSSNTGFAIAEWMPDLVFLTSPSGSNVGQFIAPANGPSQIAPNEGTYVGVRYAAPAGQMITAVNIPTVSFNVSVGMKIQITNAGGLTVAQSSRTTETDVLSLSITGLNTSAVEIRYINGTVGTGWWGAPIWAGNTVTLDKVLITTATGPECGDAQHPRPVGDLSGDCKVDIIDLNMLAAHWLEDNRPQ